MNVQAPGVREGQIGRREAGRATRAGDPSRPIPGGGGPEEGTARLVARARDGDLPAFEALYRRHVGRTHALALRMTGNASEAEDLTQEIWVRVWERLPSFRGEAGFPTWLRRVALNRILDHLRSRGWRDGQGAPLEHPAVARRSGRRDRPEDRVDLERAVAGLPDGARSVFVLHEVEGLRCREVAGTLGIAEGTVKAQLHRARKLLREVLER